MSEISTYKLIKEKLQAIPNQRLKGSWFEKVSKRFLKEHDSADEYESIDLWSDWELRGNEDDRGIDIVITTTSKEYIAVQCKFHQDSVSYNDLSSFFTKLQSGVGEIGFKKGIIISTSNLSSNALKALTLLKKLNKSEKAKGLILLKSVKRILSILRLIGKSSIPRKLKANSPYAIRKSRALTK
ncbi:hypothetical protein JP0057_09440 [Helicobacter pylori]|nr:hypothetical protein JP0057_09440 [Helicobacter pylori]